MIGLELGLSVASAALRKEATGAPICFNSDVVATAKRKLKASEMLDGEGGFCVWGKQTPAQASLESGYLPLGVAHERIASPERPGCAYRPHGKPRIFQSAKSAVHSTNIQTT